MKPYYVEGLVRKKTKSGKGGEAETVSLTIWAQTAEDALREASEQVGAAEWLEGPRLKKQSEEQRMRKMGAPELPGLDASKSLRARKDK